MMLVVNKMAIIKTTNKPKPYDHKDITLLLVLNFALVFFYLDECTEFKTAYVSLYIHCVVDACSTNVR